MELSLPGGEQDSRKVLVSHTLGDQAKEPGAARGGGTAVHSSISASQRPAALPDSISDILLRYNDLCLVPQPVPSGSQRSIDRQHLPGPTPPVTPASTTMASVLHADAGRGGLGGIFRQAAPAAAAAAAPEWFC